LRFLHLIVPVPIDHPEEYDFDILLQYVELFPEQALARLISTYLAYLGVPHSEKDEKPTPTASLDDVFGAISVSFVLLHPAYAPVDLALQNRKLKRPYNHQYFLGR